jgi:hypothetical protein
MGLNYEKCFLRDGYYEHFGSNLITPSDIGENSILHPSDRPRNIYQLE